MIRSQFTTKRLLVGMMIIALSFWLFNYGMWIDKIAPLHWTAPFSFFSIPLFGAGIGYIIGRPLLGAAVALVLEIGWVGFALMFLMD